jgi:hypothetical protein
MGALAIYETVLNGAAQSIGSLFAEHVEGKPFDDWTVVYRWVPPQAPNHRNSALKASSRYAAETTDRVVQTLCRQEVTSSLCPDVQPGRSSYTGALGYTTTCWELSTSRYTDFCSPVPISPTARIAEVRPLFTVRILGTENRQNTRDSSTTPATKPNTGVRRLECPKAEQTDYFNLTQPTRKRLRTTANKIRGVRSTYDVFSLRLRTTVSNREQGVHDTSTQDIEGSDPSSSAPLAPGGKALLSFLLHIVAS